MPASHSGTPASPTILTSKSQTLASHSNFIELLLFPTCVNCASSILPVRRKLLLSILQCIVSLLKVTCAKAVFFFQALLLRVTFERFGQYCNTFLKRFDTWCKCQFYFLSICNWKIVERPPVVKGNIAAGTRGYWTWWAVIYCSYWVLLTIVHWHFDWHATNTGGYQ